MQDSNLFPIVVRGRSEVFDGVTALRMALAEAARGMAEHKATPGDIGSIFWSARRPAAIHPARPIVDLMLRETFGGIRPATTVAPGDHEGVRVELGLRHPVPPGDEPVWRGFTLADLARQYSPRATVADMGAIFDTWRHDGAAFRQANLVAELPYGPSHGETLDLYIPKPAPRPHPLWIFIHGGYWQAVDKEHNAQFAAGMLQAGYAVAMLNYTLAPVASLHEILQQTRRAVAFLAGEASALGCDPGQLHISGHSAGGHLAAMIAALPEGQLIRSCLPLSGVFDLWPLAALPMGRTLALETADDIAELSPLHHDPLPHVRIGVAVGGGESREFQRQSTAFASVWGNAPCRIIAGRNHFDLLDGLNGGELLEFVLAITAPK